MTIVLWVIAALVGLVVVSSGVRAAFQTAHDISSHLSSPAPAPTPSTPALSQSDQAYLDLIAAKPPSITDRATLLAKGQEVCEFYRLVSPDTQDGLRQYLMQWFTIRDISAADGDLIARAAVNGLCPQYKTKSGY